MSLRLPRFTRGRPLTEEVTADKLNQIVDAIHQCEVQSGVGYDVTRNAGGTSLTVRPVVLPQGTGVSKDFIGPANSGMSHTDAGQVLGPGIESYNFECKTPTGSYTTAFVHGITFSSLTTYNTANDSGKAVLESRRAAGLTGVALSSSDLYRRIGLISNYQSNVYSSTQNDVIPTVSTCDIVTSGEYGLLNVSFQGRSPWKSTCNVATGFVGSIGSYAASSWITDAAATAGTPGGIQKCSGVTYKTGATCATVLAVWYYTFNDVGLASGNFRRDSGDTAEATFPSGNFSYLRKFDLEGLSPTAVKIRLKIRISQGAFVSIKLNGANVSYTNFETQTSTFIPIEISSGFVSGENELEIVMSNTSDSIYPSVSFEFMPTTATIVSLDNNNDAAGFADLTDEQQDLIGLGTPVQVLVGATVSIYAYKGTGSKTAQASYDFVRDA